MYLDNVISNVLLTMDFNDPTIHNGDSILPFVSFVVFFVGVIMIFIGLILVSAAKKEWNVFYAPHDEYTDDNKAKMKAGCIRGRVVYSIGIVLLVASFFI